MSTIKTNRIENVAGTHGFDVKDVATMSTEFVDNASALSGGLSVGDFYYNTTDAKITKVT